MHSHQQIRRAKVTTLTYVVALLAVPFLVSAMIEATAKTRTVALEQIVADWKHLVPGN